MKQDKKKTENAVKRHEDAVKENANLEKVSRQYFIVITSKMCIPLLKKE